MAKINKPSPKGSAAKKITARKASAPKTQPEPDLDVMPTPAPTLAVSAPVTLPPDVATAALPSPMVADGGVVGLPEYRVDTTQPDQLVNELVPTPAEPPTAPAEAAPAPPVQPAPAPPVQPAAAPPTPEPSRPPLPPAQEMNIPRSAEQMLMDQMAQEEADEEQDEDQPTDPNPPGDFSESASDKIASSTADFVLKTLGMVSNEFIIDLTKIDENSIADSVEDGDLPPQVLADVRAINRLNAKEVPFKKDYRDMLKPHLQRFCAASGIANLSPSVMLAAVSVVVVVLMFLDTRKRLSERDLFMRRIMRKYAKTAEVVESTPNAAE